MHLVENVKKVKTPPPSFLMKTYGLASENSSAKPKNFIIHNQSSSTKLASKSLKNEIIAAKRMQKLIKKLLIHL